MKIKEAVETLVKELKEDKEYYYGWQSNIAMAMYDVLPGDLPNKHDLCNKGATTFLEILTRELPTKCKICGVEYPKSKFDKCPKCEAGKPIREG